DAHTHPVFAGSRADEFAERVSGVAYRAQQSGERGIARTVRVTRETDVATLTELAAARANRFLANGTTTIEAKTGYGLDLEHEARSLEVLRQVAEQTRLRVIPTFLGAHVVPAGVDRRAYLRSLMDEMLPAFKPWAVFCDAWCEAPADRGHARGEAADRDRLRSQPRHQQFRKPAAGHEPRLRPVGDDAGGGAGRRDHACGAFAEARWTGRLLAARKFRGLHRRRRRKPGGHSLLCRREPRPADGRGRCGLAALVECVPNFSEGRRLDVITAIADAIKSAGARVIDVQADAAHNRMVVTFVAEPALAVDAAMA